MEMNFAKSVLIRDFPFSGDGVDAVYIDLSILALVSANECSDCAVPTSWGQILSAR